MQLAEAIDRLLDLVTARPGLDGTDLIDALVDEGVDRAIAARLVVFVPMAFGCEILAKVGITVDGAFQVVSEGNLGPPRGLASASEFVAAMKAAPQARLSSPAFTTLLQRTLALPGFSKGRFSGSEPMKFLLRPDVTIREIE